MVLVRWKTSQAWDRLGRKQTGGRSNRKVRQGADQTERSGRGKVKQKGQAGGRSDRNGQIENWSGRERSGITQVAGQSQNGSARDQVK